MELDRCPVPGFFVLHTPLLEQRPGLSKSPRDNDTPRIAGDSFKMIVSGHEMGSAAQDDDWYNPPTRITTRITKLDVSCDNQ
jgi:hypothetical protein